MYVTAAALFLSAIVFGWTRLHGNAGFDFSTSLSGWKLHLNGETTGWHALATVMSAVVGLVLLGVGIIKDVVGKE